MTGPAVGLERATRLRAQLASLPQWTAAAGPVVDDWLVHDVERRAGLFRDSAGNAELLLTNGLVSRRWRLVPNGATVALDNLMTGESLLRGIKPEARISLAGEDWDVGGLLGQIEYAYLRTEWLDQLTADDSAFQLTRFTAGPTQQPFQWGRRRGLASSLPWPPPGVRLDLHFEPPAGHPTNLEFVVHYELYDAIPLFCKWLTVHNKGAAAVHLDSFVNEILAVVDYETSVEGTGGNRHHPALHVESDYAFHGSTAATGDVTTH